jgi:tetratricopeptide (TPR) repeat protein
MKRLRFGLLAAGLACGLVIVAGIASGHGERVSAQPAQRLRHPGTGTGPQPGLAASGDALSAAISAAQVQLQGDDRDWNTWANLGAAYVEEGRVTVDPSYYPKAEGALRRSIELNPDGNFAADIGLGALANARHEFGDAAVDAQRALAADPYSATANGVLADAETQLGDYSAATAAVQRMLDLKPGIDSFSRASYDREIHGDPAGAVAALQDGLDSAFTPADTAFCRYYLGELAFNSGDLAEAARQYEAGIAADPGYVPPLEGKAKVEAARGDTAGAIRDYTAVVNRVPQPQYVLELGDLQASLGHQDAAQEQYRLLAAEQRLFYANGVVDDLTSAQFAADHGDPAGALRDAEAEWGRRHSVLVADALAWALHVNGRDAEALGYARQATALGEKNAVFLFHRGMIERSLGQRDEARRDLSDALRINPHFSVLQAPVATAALAGLGGAA